MKDSKRKFLKEAAVAGAGVAFFGMPAVGSAQAGRDGAMLTAQATAVMKLFGLRYPIFQAPWGGPELASAISNAGAMGAIALWGSTPDAAHEAVTRLRSLTTRAFIVNYVLTFEPRSLPAALDAGAPVVGFSWGLPSKAVVASIRNGGAKFGVQVATVAGARAALDLGAEYLVCQGHEAGGHIQSSTPLYELLPPVVEEATQIPVLAAGGIGDGLKIRAALVAGASGVVLGTRFVATRESLAHVEYKNAIVHAQANDTALSVCFQDGWPAAIHRTLRNGTQVRWETAGCPAVGARPGEGDIVATRPNGTRVLRYQITPPQRGDEGTVTDLAMYAGQSVDDVKDVPGAAELVARLWAECLATP